MGAVAFISPRNAAKREGQIGAKKTLREIGAMQSGNQIRFSPNRVLAAMGARTRRSDCSVVHHAMYAIVTLIRPSIGLAALGAPGPLRGVLLGDRRVAGIAIVTSVSGAVMILRDR